MTAISPCIEHICYHGNLGLVEFFRLIAVNKDTFLYYLRQKPWFLQYGLFYPDSTKPLYRWHYDINFLPISILHFLTSFPIQETATKYYDIDYVSLPYLFPPTTISRFFGKVRNTIEIHGNQLLLLHTRCDVMYSNFSLVCDAEAFWPTVSALPPYISISGPGFEYRCDTFPNVPFPTWPIYANFNIQFEHPNPEFYAWLSFDVITLDARIVDGIQKRRHSQVEQIAQLAQLPDSFDYQFDSSIYRISTCNDQQKCMFCWKAKYPFTQSWSEQYEKATHGTIIVPWRAKTREKPLFWTTRFHTDDWRAEGFYLAECVGSDFRPVSNNHPLTFAKSAKSKW